MPDIFNARMDEQKQINQDRAAKKARVSRPAESFPPLESAHSSESIAPAESAQTSHQPADQDFDFSPDQSSFNPDHPQRELEDYSEVMRAEEPSNNPFNSYIPKPLNIFFSSQHRSEKIVLILRKHIITQVPWLVTIFFLSLLPLFALAFGVASFAPANFVFAGIVLWYLLLTGFAIESFLSWFFHVFIITDERIIDVDFLSLIYKRVSSAKIDNIEDVTAVTGGAIRSVFNFGTVKIQTAGARPEIAFEDVPRPNQVTKLLNELILEEEREKMEGRVN